MPESMPDDMTKPKIGIALGSGAARGWAHIGVLLALAEEGIEPDIVCGCSMGALVGAVYVTGELAALEKLVLEIDWKDVLGFLDVDLTSGGLIEGKHIEGFLGAIDNEANIEDMKKPFIAIATDMVTGREVWLQKGPVMPAVRASMAVPGVFSPVELEGKWLLDGGLVNPVPVSACRALGADIVIAVNLNGNLMGKRWPEPKAKPDPETKGSFDKLFEMIPASIRQSFEKISPYQMFSKSTVPGYFDVTASALNIMQDLITRSRLAGNPPHIMLTPRLGDIGMLELNRAQEAIVEGRASVKRALPLIRTYLT